jgi:hypothetical protein
MNVLMDPLHPGPVTKLKCNNSWTLSRFFRSRAVRVGLGTAKGANRNLHVWMQQTEEQDIPRNEDAV